MHLFILKHVNQLTDRYHSGGSLVIIAKDLDDAKKTIENLEYCKPTDDEWNKALDFKLRCGYKNQYFIFQDAGCC